MEGWTEEAVNAANAKSTRKSSKKVAAIATQGQRGKTGGKGAKNSADRQKFHLLLVQTCKNMGVELKTEVKVDEKRKFRFDYAIPEISLAIEYEGLFSKKSRHTTKTGYTNDCTKYNLAAMNGWRVLRYTAMNYQQVITDLLTIKTKEK